MRCIDVIKPHLYIGGILDINRERINYGNLKILMSARVICGPCIPTNVQKGHTQQLQAFVNLRKLRLYTAAT